MIRVVLVDGHTEEVPEAVMATVEADGALVLCWDAEGTLVGSYDKGDVKSFDEFDETFDFDAVVEEPPPPPRPGLFY